MSQSQNQDNHADERSLKQEMLRRSSKNINFL